MKVILLQDVPKVGKKYEIKNVKDGFARNFLLLKNLAKIAEAGTLQEIEAAKQKEAREKERRTESLVATMSDLEGKEIVYEVKAGDKGQLFDKIDAKDIKNVLKKETGQALPEKFIKLGEAIKKIGRYEIILEADDREVKFGLNVKKASPEGLRPKEQH